MLKRPNMPLHVLPLLVLNQTSSFFVESQKGGQIIHLELEQRQQYKGGGGG